MPKMKTHRGAAKRFRVTARGKILHRKATGNHFLIKKSGGRKRRITGMSEVTAERENTRKLLGGGRSKGRPSPAPSTDE
ncbi:MAG TPA: 50S ribosomal protein L35 [Actinomycetota bacterium]|jgi:large subunit ribosomal protein L35